MQAICGLISFTLGLALSIQSGINTCLREIMNNPLFATTVNFSIGVLMLLIIIAVAFRRKIYRIPTVSVLRETKWRMWTGGPLGIAFVMTGTWMPT